MSFALRIFTTKGRTWSSPLPTISSEDIVATLIAVTAPTSNQVQLGWTGGNGGISPGPSPIEARPVRSA
jgi:hypothetical protein